MVSLDSTAIVVILSLGVSAFIRSLVGFGDGVIAMGLITGWVGLQTATPLVALIGTVISSVILASQWQKLDLRTALPLTLATLVGIPFGLVLLKLAPEPIARTALGGLLIAYALYGLLGLKLPVVRDDRATHLFGFLAGILGGSYNMHGSVVAIHGTLKQLDAEQFRLTLQGYFFFTSFLILIGHAIAGLWTTQVWSLFIVSLPVVGLSIWIGDRISRRIKGDRFSKLVFAVLLGVGLLSLV
ncbi:sulfite exporter TauE/SafE family protein [Leptolyngbya ohadii]|uniref:sulfite exporter TauE/SafE family protein n=1 Tax=Leptolyngbya ohadii TaxID=1962290 RepID=UPI000B59B1F3|nr:sulfite exporter TauE/SafE family protein [Leptolyngbya ohadii]